MPRYVDTQLKKFPFDEVCKASKATKEDDLDHIPKSSRHLFEFDYLPDEPWVTSENLEDINLILLQELGDTLDELAPDSPSDDRSSFH